MSRLPPISLPQVRGVELAWCGDPCKWSRHLPTFPNATDVFMTCCGPECVESLVVPLVFPNVNRVFLDSPTPDPDWIAQSVLERATFYLTPQRSKYASRFPKETGTIVKILKPGDYELALAKRKYQTVNDLPESQNPHGFNIEEVSNIIHPINLPAFNQFAKHQTTMWQHPAGWITYHNLLTFIHLCPL
jgi:hypothetical protein